MSRLFSYLKVRTIQNILMTLLAGSQVSDRLLDISCYLLCVGAILTHFVFACHVIFGLVSYNYTFVCRSTSPTGLVLTPMLYYKEIFCSVLFVSQ